jgi:hypothetical protein
MSSVLPKYFSSEWSFAQFRVPDEKTICAFADAVWVAYMDVVAQRVAVAGWGWYHWIEEIGAVRMVLNTMCVDGY